ncbi:MAG: hypothetical protein ACREYC_07390 [Gammaproteobacteria bacterium]
MKRSDVREPRAVKLGTPYHVFTQAAPPEKTTVPGTAPVAVLVVHGMGQQMPLQTLDSVTEGIMRAQQAKTGERPRPPEVSAAAVGDELLRRVELRLVGHDQQTRLVHVYEAYWAPITEGQIGITDVIRFLWDAGWNGLRNTRDVFQRWVLGAYRDFGRFPRTTIYLHVALWTVLALVLLNAIIALAGGASALVGERLVPPALLGDLTIVLLVGAGSVLVFALILFIHRWLGWLIPLCLVVVFTSLGLVATIARFRLGGEPFGLTAVSAHPVGHWVILAFWVLLLLASNKVRKVIVQYVGDVAIYIAPHLLDRFDELRGRIRSRVYKTAEYIYGMHAQGSTDVTYRKVAIVGHSLGSVAAYDTLNTLIALDELRGSPLHVLERTSLLLTFGSPLDKVAFVFATQGTKTSDTRERLAATTRPLIQSYHYRTFPWINVYSDQDLISGKLDFYDNPNDSQSKERINPAYPELREVKNDIDSAARTPLLAHVQYWQNRCVFDWLHEVIRR